MDRRPVLVGLGTASMAALSGCLDGLPGSRVSEPISNAFPVAEETSVPLTNRNGPVDVEPADGDALTLSGEKHASSQDGLDSISIEVIQGERFAVNVRFARGSQYRSRSVDLIVGIPSGRKVNRVTTWNGPITARDLDGDLSAATANGDVDLTGIRGYVRGKRVTGTSRRERVRTSRPGFD